MRTKTIKNVEGNYVSPMICVVPFLAEGVMCESVTESRIAGWNEEDEDDALRF